MKITALLTGKASSTLADKNILPLFNKPLVSYPARAARRSKYISYFYASSDSEKILEIVGRIGYKKILRPEYLARPNSKHVEAIRHALREIERLDKLKPDILIVLLANSAVIKTEWIDICIKEILTNKSVSAVVPVCLDLDRHPFRAKRINKKGFLEPFFDFKNKTISTNRQELEPSYFLCHNFWVLNVKKTIFSKNGQQPWAFMGNNIKPFIIDECCDVHKEEDFKKTEEWIKKYLKK
ncbi:MAG: CMP-N-acetylneuraminic acid synthetase [Candidatus Omnitrophica bacterium]|nr:CMP-N-acetylneuraminic acid synthetase [Candidatus Omnitrophota bacterium]MDD5591859.1 CMP-N-acetylneuraminic acid synthetase [Candidatus Omnitrophota bacterium]